MIYVVKQGEYSDCSNLAAFSTREAAQEYADIHSGTTFGGECYVEELTFDIPETRQVVNRYGVHIDFLTGEMRDRDVEKVFEDEVYESVPSPPIKSHGLTYNRSSTVYSASQEKARLIALECLRLWGETWAGRGVRSDRLYIHLEGV